MRFSVFLTGFEIHPVAFSSEDEHILLHSIAMLLACLEAIYWGESV